MHSLDELPSDLDASNIASCDTKLRLAFLEVLYHQSGEMSHPKGMLETIVRSSRPDEVRQTHLLDISQALELRTRSHVQWKDHSNALFTDVSMIAHMRGVNSI